MNRILHKKRFTGLLTVIIFLCSSLYVLGADDDTPFFAGGGGSPNVMIILDNSNSMQDSPYMRDDGTTYSPYDTPWKRGVKINDDCNNDGTADDPCILDNSSPGVAGGAIQYNDSQYITETDHYTLPSQTPPFLPGLSSSSSVVTSIRNTTTTCPTGLECDDRIYDSNITVAFSISTYQFWKVIIKDITAGTTDERNIKSFNSSGKFWEVYGDYIQYNPSHSYSYELASGVAGDVTFSDSSNVTRVHDRNLDWGSINTNWNALYSNHILKVVAGTNMGEQRILTGRNASYGYWQIDTAFPQPCDDTTKYQILGVADDSKVATGGNHPDSKWYQAKLALTKFLESDSIKTCDEEDGDGNCLTTERYLMNVGLATFLQARVPQTRAQYYRKRATDPQFRYRYYQRQTLTQYPTVPDGCSNGNPVLPATFIYDGERTGSVGLEFNTAYATGSCNAQTIRYRVTSIYCSPTDSLPDRMVVKLESNTAWTTSPQGTDPYGDPQWGYTAYGWRYFAAGASTDCTSFTPPDPDGGWKRVLIGSSPCNVPCEYVAPVPYYETSMQTTPGDLRKTNPATPGYIEQTPPAEAAYVVTPYKGYCAGSWGNCTTPNAEDTSGDGYGDWKLVESDLTNVPINGTGTLGTIKPIIYDNSIYRIPSWSGNADHPHGWSYKRTQKVTTATKDDGSALNDHHIYITGTGTSSSNLSKWGANVQKSPYFPSESGNPLSKFSNFNGDDQVFFVDLPEYNAAADDKGDDRSGVNVNAIKAAIGLTRVPDPTNSNRVFTMAPISSGSLSVSTEMAVNPQGTPLAASLEDAKTYFESYIMQDPFTQGGCRKNYIILLTDGLETGGGVPETAAKNLKDLVVDNKISGVLVYVIGFGLDKTSQATLNDIAVAGGTTKAYFANDVNGLVSILAHDITEDILSGTYARATPVVTMATKKADQDLVRYDAYFDYPTWRGHLKAWSLDEKGKIIGRAPYWASNCTGTPVLTGAVAGSADAGCIMAEDYPDAGSSSADPSPRRTLYTNVQVGTNANGDPVYNRIDFNPSEVTTLSSLVNPTSQDINESGSTDDNDAKDIINYVHHPGYDNQKYKGNRDPQWPLADIYNSSPIIVPAPMDGGCTTIAGVETWDEMPGYCAYKAAHKNRKTMVYIGTNGGMIEAIAAGHPAKDAVLAADGTTVLTPAVPEESGGYEKWGYIPNNALGKLSELKEGHRFLMDLPINSAEVDTSVGHDGTEWKTMLIAGQRRGGNSYTALDITDPDNPQPMWEFTHSNLGQTWSIPEFGRIVINGVKTSVVFFGGGYSPNADVGNRLFIVRAKDGLLIKEFTVGSNANDVPSGLTPKIYMTNKSGEVVDYHTNTTQSPEPACTPVNQTLKYNTDVVYFGDTSGTVWRLSDLNNFEPADVAGQPFGPPWAATLTALYVPDSDKQMPIYYPPVVQDIKKGTIDCSGTVAGCVRRYILVGTGDEQNPISTTDGSGVPEVNYFFEIEDREYDSVVRDVHDPAWTAAELSAGKFRLNWRINLGFNLPQDKYGFLLAPNGSRVKKDSQDILDLQTYILDWSVYNTPANGWSINGSGNLLNNGNVKAIAGNFLIRHNTDDSPHHDNALYNDAVGSLKVADDGTYHIRDLSLWITDRDGCFYDTDGTCLIDTSTYHYDNDGWLTNGGTRVIEPEYNQYVLVITAMGEKVLAAPTSQTGNVYFTSYTPAGGCDMGRSFLYGFSISDCSALGGQGVLTEDEYGKDLLTRDTKLDLTGFATGVLAAGPYLNFNLSGGDGIGEGGDGDDEDVLGDSEDTDDGDGDDVCGDDKCTGGETSTSCPDDCSPVCGDGRCTGGENKATCQDDCESQTSAAVDKLKLLYWRQD